MTTAEQQSSVNEDEEEEVRAVQSKHLQYTIQAPTNDTAAPDSSPKSSYDSDALSVTTIERSLKVSHDFVLV